MWAAVLAAGPAIPAVILARLLLVGALRGPPLFIGAAAGAVGAGSRLRRLLTLLLLLFREVLSSAFPRRRDGAPRATARCRPLTLTVVTIPLKSSAALALAGVATARGRLVGLASTGLLGGIALVAGVLLESAASLPFIRFD